LTDRPTPEPSLIDGKRATRRHILLFDEDYEFIKLVFGEHPGVSAAIRIIIHEAVKRHQQKALNRAVAVPVKVEGVDEMLEGLE